MAEEIIKKKKKSKAWLWILFVILVLAAAVGAFILGMKGNGNSKIAGLLSDGKKYLNELNYDKAIAAYEQALAIDPKSEEAYLGLADVYITMAEDAKVDGDGERARESYKKARDILEDGLEETGSEEIEEKLKEIEEEMKNDPDIVIDDPNDPIGPPSPGNNPGKKPGEAPDGGNASVEDIVFDFDITDIKVRGYDLFANHVDEVWGDLAANYTVKNGWWIDLYNSGVQDGVLRLTEGIAFDNSKEAYTISYLPMAGVEMILTMAADTRYVSYGTPIPSSISEWVESPFIGHNNMVEFDWYEELVKDGAVQGSFPSNLGPGEFYIEGLGEGECFHLILDYKTNWTVFIDFFYTGTRKTITEIDIIVEQK